MQSSDLTFAHKGKLPGELYTKHPNPPPSGYYFPTPLTLSAIRSIVIKDDILSESVKNIRQVLFEEITIMASNFQSQSADEEEDLFIMLENLLYDRLLLDHHLASQDDDLEMIPDLEKQESPSKQVDKDFAKTINF